MTSPLQAVRDGYDRWAAVYDHDDNPMQGLEGPLLRAAVGDARGLRALDVGCGTGRHAVWLAASGASVTAVDFSEGMLAEARRKPGADAVRWVRHDLTQPLPFTDRFDLAVSGLVLEHIADLGTYFATLRSALVPEGRAVVSAMHPAMFLKGAQARFTDPANGELVMPGSLPHSVAEFVMGALHAGFTIDAVTEHAPTDETALRYPRAAKYVGWPMLVLLVLRAG
ncbi:MAG: methyltransferase domain-containing protein [Gemmatimonadetes bacterium]|nr:methyltransferase domain-containing protein [Gemmatimonadota bacterium]